MKNVIRTLRSAVRFLLPQMWYIEGPEKTTGESLALIWCGSRKQQAYMISRIFGTAKTEQKRIGRRPIMLLDRLQESHKCCLAIVAGPQQILSAVSRDEDFCVPWWIDAELDLDEAQESMGRPKSLKDDLRRVRKNRLGFTVTKDAANYKFFYDRFYLPTITASHGSAALLSAFEERWKEIESGRAEVMFVTMDERPIGGLILNYRNEIPALRDIGILDGNKEVLKTGVITAANYFAMTYLKEKGFERVCLGLSRCFLNDGVLSYKQKWKPTLMETSQESFMFRVSRLCKASRGFLRSSSYVAEQDGGFHFAFFAANDEDARANQSQLTRLSSIYGIDAYSSIDVSGQRPQLRRASWK